MSDLKQMYRTLAQDPFPGSMRLILGEQEIVFKKRTWTIDGEVKGLRYGENPGQPAALYEAVGGGVELDGVRFRGPGQGLVSALTEEHMLQAGKHPGKTNLTDVDNGLNILQYLDAKPAALILKHNNPCGAAWAEDLPTALERAYWGDRVAAFGGAVVVNRPLDKASAEFLNGPYFEVVAAPDFEPGVIDILKQRKNLRILRIPGIADLNKIVDQPFLELKSLMDGGVIAQFSFQNRIRTVEDFLPAEAKRGDEILIARAPTPQEAEDLLFAWAVEAGVTSNSVIFARNGATVSIGTGEQDRVGCVEIAVHKAYAKHADALAFKERKQSIYELQLAARSDAAAREALDDIQARTGADRGGLAGTVLISDGFFPFRDGVDAALAHGVTAIAQPGGSVRDAEVIEAVNQASPQVAMVFTGQRSFRH